MIKIKNNHEIIQEEVSEELNEKIKENLELESNCDASQHFITKFVSMMYNSLQHYFLINAGMPIGEKANFVIKIDYKEEQEGIVSTNTIQIL